MLPAVIYKLGKKERDGSARFLRWSVFGRVNSSRIRESRLRQG